MFVEEMIGAGGEWGNRLTLFATGLVACSESACGGEGGKRNAGVINGKCGGAGFRTCGACCGLSASGALTSVFKGGERGGLTKFNCPGMLDLDDLTVNHRSALLLETVVGLCLGRLVELAYQSLLVMEAYIEAVAVLA